MNEVAPFGKARQTLQGPEEDEGDVRPSYDDLGRGLTRYQSRDLVATAYVSLTTGTKTELRASNSGEFSDLYQMSFSNNSGAATQVVLSDESTTVRTFEVPANTSRTITFQVPLKQSATGVSWYVDMPDITGTTVEVAAEFTREI